MSNKRWTAFEQSTRINNQRLGPPINKPHLLPNSSHRAPYFLCIRALTQDFDRNHNEVDKNSTKNAEKRQDQDKLEFQLTTCQFSKACMSAVRPHPSHHYLHNPVTGCQSFQAVNMKDHFL